MNRWILDPKNPHVDQVRQNLRNAVDATPDDKAYMWERKLYRKPRTDKQNAALFAVAYPPLRDHTGYTIEELHKMFCISFFGPREIEFNGVVLTEPLRTTTTNEEGKRDPVDRKTFGEFFDHVQQKGAEIGVHIPDPDPMHGRFPDGR